jgi:Glycosyltransferase sugar-binding region containing DXD motif
MLTLSFGRASEIVRSLPLDAEGTYRTSNAVDAPEVPRRLIRFWDGETPPADVVALLATWAPLHDGYEMVTFNDATARAFFAEHYAPRYLAGYDACTHPAMRCDLFRLAYLYQCGGIYVDADERCLQSVEEIRVHAGSLAVRRMVEANRFTYFANAPIFCAAGLPLLKECLDAATDRLLTSRWSRPKVWVTTGPGNLSRVFAQRVVLDGAHPMRVRVIDDWPRYSAMIHCEYKKTSRYWMFHDERGLKGAWMRGRVLARRGWEAFVRWPLARRMWHAVKVLRPVTVTEEAAEAP